MTQAPKTSLQTLGSLTQSTGSADWSRWTKNRYVYYDYVQYPSAGAAEIQFFTVPLGGVDSYLTTVTKTKEQTNMNESRSFGRVNYMLKAIRTHIRLSPKNRQPAGISGQASVISFQYTALMNKLVDLMRMGTMVINIGQKEYYDINQPFVTAPPGFGPIITQTGANPGSAIQAIWATQDTDPNSVYQVQDQLIEAGQTFNVKISFDNANSPAFTNLVNGVTPLVEIGIIFDGYVLRPLQ